MNTPTIHNHKGNFAKIRNSPLFFLPLLLVGGYALAALAYTLIMANAGGNNGRDAAYYSNLNSGSAQSPKTNATTHTWKADDLKQVISTIDVAPAKTYLFNSKKTRDYFTSAGSNYDQFLAQWRYYFQARGIKYVDIQDDDLTPALKPGLLILPSTVALSSMERTAIQAFEKNGGSVLATWATGTRNGDGERLDHDFLHKQFGINISGEFSAQDNEKFLIVSGETAVAYSLPAGYRIWMGLADNHERPLRVSGGDYVAGRFMDYGRTPGISKANEAIVYTELGSSRRVYFAFAENSWRFEPANIYTMLDDALNWLHRRPGAYLANWPYPYRAAQILEMDTEQDFTKAINFADLLDANGFQGTFYSLTSVATRYPDIIRHLELKHEIAYHGDVHDAFKGQPREIQSKRLDAMQRELQPLVTDPSRLRGFRPPYELADQVVESLLFEKGFGHILANADGTGGMLPYLSPTSPRDFQKGLIVLPRTQRDDMNFTEDGFNSQDMLKAMQDDFDLAHEYGALGALSLHSQHFELDTPVAKSMTQFLSHIKSSRNKTWIAPSGTIEAWWRNRSLFKSELSGSPTKMLLNITVEKPGMSWRTALVMANPARGLQPKIRNTKVGTTLPLLVPLDDYRTAIVFNALEPGHYSYYLSY